MDDKFIHTQDGATVSVSEWSGEGAAFIALSSKYGAASVVLTRREALELADALEMILVGVEA